MPDTTKTFYLTTPIYYVNARPHIGHAYSTIVADVLARRHRLLGDDTYFLTGTDEHGQKIERAAAAAGIPPQQYADQVSKTFSDLWSRMGITHNQFIRTTDPNHKRGVQKLFTDLYEKGQIYLSSYTGQYSVGEEMFVEGPPGTIGPDGRPTETVTEENFFFRLSDYQLPLLNLIESNELQITPDSSRNEVLAFLRGNVPSLSPTPTPTLSSRPERSAVERPAGRPTPTLSSRPESAPFADAAERPAGGAAAIAHTAAGTPYIPGALRDLSISRSSFTWGIPVPEEIQTAAGAKEKHVIYVWLDALTNYMTALGYGSPDDTLWQKFWPADLHLVGKEITRFHCIYWPAFLLAAGLPLPKQVTANGWLLFDNSKMSKSKGNVVRTETILDAFGNELYAKQFPDSTKPDRDLFAADVLRYYLLREIPFGQDGSFSFDSMITRYNADLANGYGNLVSRTLGLINQYLGGAIPEHTNWPNSVMHIHERPFRGGRVGPLRSVGPFVSVTDLPIARLGAACSHFYQRQMQQLNFSSGMDFKELLAAAKENRQINEGDYGALDYVMLLVGQTDEFMSLETPWKLAKQADPESQARLRDTLYIATENIRIITALIYPFMPFAASRVWSALGLGEISARDQQNVIRASTQLHSLDEEQSSYPWGGLQPGTKLGPLAPIFPRADKGLAQIMSDMENPTPEPTSTFDPAAGPRTASLTEPGPLPVGGSTAHTTRTGPTPSHTEAQASGIFANPLTTDHSPLTTSSEITIDDFAKIELRVAQITLAERIPKADKLLRLEVDLGPLGTRQILSGIAEHYAPEDLLHRKIVVITNLAPRKMRGLESHGMLLAASDGDGGKPILATFAENIPNGTRLK